MDRIIGKFLSLLPTGIIDIGLRKSRNFRIRKGNHVYDYDWDVLVILDACRYDMYREVVGNGKPVLSVASTSTEWMDITFDGQYEHEVANTGYISANPFSRRLEESRFGLIDHVWQDYWDDDIGSIPPEPVTDHGIAAAQSEEFDRVILHYMQPHFPFIGSEQFGRLGRSGFGMEGKESQNVWDMVRDGSAEPEAVIEAYYENLRYVYDFVETVLQNVRGRVLITADHANALGEWGMWGHRAYVPFRAVRQVPWDIRECTNNGTYEPSAELSELKSGVSDEKIEDRLRSLGYVNS